jgi:hypothetical protein
MTQPKTVAVAFKNSQDHISRPVIFFRFRTNERLPSVVMHPAPDAFLFS